jgi:hypothetical protein
LKAHRIENGVPELVMEIPVEKEYLVLDYIKAKHNVDTAEILYRDSLITIKEWYSCLSNFEQAEYKLGSLIPDFCLAKELQGWTRFCIDDKIQFTE